MKRLLVALSWSAREAAPAKAMSLLRGDLLLCLGLCGRSRRGLIETTKRNNQLQNGVLHRSLLVLQQAYRMEKA